MRRGGPGTDCRRGRARPAAAQIGYKAAADAEQKKTLLLRDFHPVQMLHVPAHQVPRARFYVIDVHNHVNDAAGIDEHMDPKRVVEVMDNTNVKTVVILTGMWGDKLQHVIDEMVKPYPGRFIVFTQLDWSKVDDPDFGQEMVRQLDDAVARGARGLKFLKDLGLGVRDKSGKLLAIDDPRLDPVWRECGRLGIPVSIHTGDPEAFFLPTDGKNERYEELTEHPDWSFYGPQYPKLEELLEARNRVFARHPETRFVSLHMGWPENLPWVSRMLDEHPNVMVEFGAREAELGRQPRQTREFFLKYQDRDHVRHRQRQWTRRCIAITSAGWKPRTSRSITGDIRGRAGGKFTASTCRTRCWKKSIT